MQGEGDPPGDETQRAPREGEHRSGWDGVTDAGTKEQGTTDPCARDSGHPRTRGRVRKGTGAEVLAVGVPE